MILKYGEPCNLSHLQIGNEDQKATIEVNSKENFRLSLDQLRKPPPTNNGHSESGATSTFFLQITVPADKMDKLMVTCILQDDEIANVSKKRKLVEQELDVDTIDLSTGSTAFGSPTSALTRRLVSPGQMHNILCQALAADMASKAIHAPSSQRLPEEPASEREHHIRKEILKPPSVGALETPKKESELIRTVMAKTNPVIITEKNDTHSACGADSRDGPNVSSLHAAAAANDENAVRSLLLGGANWKQTDVNGKLAIERATSPAVWKAFGLKMAPSQDILSAAKNGDVVDVMLMIGEGFNSLAKMILEVEGKGSFNRLQILEEDQKAKVDLTSSYPRLMVERRPPSKRNEEKGFSTFRLHITIPKDQMHHLSVSCVLHNAVDNESQPPEVKKRKLDTRDLVLVKEESPLPSPTGPSTVPKPAVPTSTPSTPSLSNNRPSSLAQRDDPMDTESSISAVNIFNNVSKRTEAQPAVKSEPGATSSATPKPAAISPQSVVNPAASLSAAADESQKHSQFMAQLPLSAHAHGKAQLNQERQSAIQAVQNLQQAHSKPLQASSPQQHLVSIPQQVQAMAKVAELVPASPQANSNNSNAYSPALAVVPFENLAVFPGSQSAVASRDTPVTIPPSTPQHRRDSHHDSPSDSSGLTATRSTSSSASASNERVAAGPAGTPAQSERALTITKTISNEKHDSPEDMSLTYSPTFIPSTISFSTLENEGDESRKLSTGRIVTLPSKPGSTSSIISLQGLQTGISSTASSAIVRLPFVTMRNDSTTSTVSNTSELATDILSRLAPSAPSIPKELSTEPAALHLAASLNEVRAVRNLLAAGADFKHKDSDGKLPIEKSTSPAVWAAFAEKMSSSKYDILQATQRGLTVILRCLIGKGADLSQADDHGLTALHFAAKSGNLEVVEILLNGGASKFIEAVGKIEMPEIHNYQAGMRPLHLASAFGHIKVVETILKHGARIDVADRWGRSALLWATRYSHIDVAKLLVNHGAPVNVRDRDGWTPLLSAASRGLSDLVELYVALGADVTQKTSRGNTVFDFARGKRFARVLKDKESS
ncbi:Neurogenic locus notch protein 2 [Phlyctochytrium bullatum]|nr:Neurogenic locus notch protein 2 [Phlyctochytrium bullatum]